MFKIRNCPLNKMYSGLLWLPYTLNLLFKLFWLDFFDCYCSEVKHMEYPDLFFPPFTCSSEQDMTLGFGAYHPNRYLLFISRAGSADSPGPRTKCTIPGMAAHYRACACGAFGRWPGSGMAGEAWGRACRNTGRPGGSRLLHNSWSTEVYEAC